MGDVAHHTRLRAAAEKSALRPFQHFDALEIDGVQVEIVARQHRRLFVHIDGDIREIAGDAIALGALGAETETPHVNLTLARAVGCCRHVGEQLDVLVEGRDIHLRDRLARNRLDRDRDFLEIFGPALRCYDDFAECATGVFAGARHR